MKKNRYKYLNIKGTVLDNFQLQKYMERVASNHNITNASSATTYPIPRLKENYEFIKKTYDILNEHIKLGIEIYPAGEWLLDNFYIIEETVKTIENTMDLKKYKDFPGILDGTYKGYARIYVLATEIVAYNDNKITDDILKLTISSYQKRKTLAMAEIWNLWVFLEIAIIENIRFICEKIYSAQLQKYRAESIIERIIEKKEAQKQNFKLDKKMYKEKVSYKEIRYPFIEYMSYRLKKYGKQALPYLSILEEEVSKTGMTLSSAIEKEHYDIAISKVSLGNSITSLKEILRVNFLSLFEDINGVEDILKKDPANVYSKMDYKTKEYYRNKIKEISEKTKISEIYIANKALELSSKQTNLKKSHIGYYLISDGYYALMESLQIKYRGKKGKQVKYIGAIYFFLFILVGLLGYIFYNKVKNIWIGLALVISLIIPVSEFVIQILNYILSKSVMPKLLPKLDFINGIPEEYTTMVVIPTIISSKEKVREIYKKLEIYYLANKSQNIYFTLLGDCTSGKNKNEKIDEEVIKTGLDEVEKLNQKYNDKIFNFIYRNRKWNASEECYLGWERKRGLLLEFNRFLITGEEEFRENTIDFENVKNKIKYIITLDADTNLVLESGLELIGTMAHVLNTPIIKDGIVKEGHAIIQPRVGIDLDSSRKSLFSKIYAGLRWCRFICKCSFRYISR